MKKSTLCLICLLLLFIVTLISCYLAFINQYNVYQAQVSSTLLANIVVDALLPRIAMAILVGGALSVSSLLLQQITHNPLASDTTLSINSGAYLLLLVATLFVPSLLHWLDPSLIALIGALLALCVVLALSYRQQFLSTRMLLAGLVLNLYLGAIAAIIVIFNPESSQALFQWEAGSLVQDSWQDVIKLAIVSVVCLALFMLLSRALQIMQLSDDQASSLGVNVKWIRALILVSLCYLCATAISLVGMIGFIGLASATIINQFQLISIKLRLCATYLMGALLLLLTDSVLILLQHYSNFYLPVGATSAFIGTPLLLYLIFKVLPNQLQVNEPSAGSPPNNAVNKIIGLWIIGGLFVLLLAVSFFVKNSAHGLLLLDFDSVRLQLKLPRILTAIVSGAMLSLCGMVLQRLTRNPMASPELLGISSGAAIFVITAFLFFNIGYQYLWLFALSGAIVTFVFIALVNYRNQFQPDKVILTGVAISALLTALLRLFLANGDPRAQYLLIWLSGSTYASQLSTTLMYALIGAVCLVILWFAQRILTLFLLPAPIARSLGLPVSYARIGLIMVVTLLITLATLQIGPLSFIGLLAPLIARLLGFSETRWQMAMSLLIGSGLMMVADWIGRNIAYPYEIPAGLIASLIGGTCFLALMRKL
ncbi:Fe(3+)-hydroxamate ABC transporter permease FhuB [Orbus sturtevantii]|uniref:Fe(3+)-hydroxamate ABC transporter permease FhuB n=1 Tax=Orbus sturtevantii TaxID=3074109 RepID=UPI00370D7F54